MRKTNADIRANDETIQAVAAEVAEFLDEQDGAQPAKEKAKLPTLKQLKKKKWFKWAVAALALLLLFGVSRLLRPRAEQAEITYTYQEAEQRDLTQSINATGTVQPAASYELTSLVSGEVLEAPFEEGQIVQEGDLLYVIDSSDMESNMERAQNSYQRALDSYNDLVESAEDYRITAPSTGVITKLNIEVGDKVNAGSQIGTVADRSAAYLRVPFFSEDAGKMRVGQTAVVTISGSFETVNGVVDSISELEEVGLGGALIRQVKIKVINPRGINENTAATATVSGMECNNGANFTFPEDKTITAQASGKIASIRIKEGSSVGKDAVIAVIDDENLQDQLKNSKSSLDDARLSLENAQDQLDEYRITAPISGTVIEKNLKVGDTLDSANKTANSSAIAIIYDLSHLEFTVNIDELDIKKVEVGQEVRITADSLEGQTFTGKVSKVSINGTTQSGATAYPVTVIIDDGTDLLPGMNVSADIIVMERSDVVAVPSEAVSRGNTVLVSVKSETGRRAIQDGAEEEKAVPGYVRVKVELGANDDTFVEITSGLEAGDQIAFVELAPTDDDEGFMGPMGGMSGMHGGGMQGRMPDGGMGGDRGGMQGGGPMR